MKRAAILVCVASLGAAHGGEPADDLAAKRSERQSSLEKSRALALKLLSPGMSFAEARELFPELLCGERDAQTLATCSFFPSPPFMKNPSELDSLAGMRADHWSIKFDQADRLAIVYVNMSSGNFPEVMAATRAKYGKPTASETSVFQNGFGAKFSGRSSRWNKGAAILEIDEYYGDRNTMQVRLGTRAAADAVKKFARDNATKRGVKDL